MIVGVRAEFSDRVFHRILRNFRTAERGALSLVPDCGLTSSQPASHDNSNNQCFPFAWPIDMNLKKKKKKLPRSRSWWRRSWLSLRRCRQFLRARALSVLSSTRRSGIDSLVASIVAARGTGVHILIAICLVPRSVQLLLRINLSAARRFRTKDQALRIRTRLKSLQQRWIFFLETLEQRFLKQTFQFSRKKPTILFPIFLPSKWWEWKISRRNDKRLKFSGKNYTLDKDTPDTTRGFTFGELLLVLTLYCGLFRALVTGFAGFKSSSALPEA